MWLHTAPSRTHSRNILLWLQAASCKLQAKELQIRLEACSLKPEACSGMTLVEMLLAVTLFSTMMGATGSLLQSALRAQLTWGQATAPYLQMERGLDGVERDVAFAKRFFGMPVIGAKDRLELAVASTEWMKVVYRIDTSGESPALVREEHLWRQEAGAGEAIARQTILVLEEGQFAFGHLDAQGQLVWTDAWDGVKDGVPKLVRLSVTIPTAHGSEAIARVFRNPPGNLPIQQNP